MAAALALALFLLPSGGCYECMDYTCPVAHGVSVSVTTAPAMAVAGVQVTLTGPQTVTMRCGPENAFVLCLWPDGVAFTQGAYTIEVSAPGYQTTTLQTEVSVASTACGCTSGTLQPSIVSLTPSDGGVD
jgi:hypothetical protein